MSDTENNDFPESGLFDELIAFTSVDEDLSHADAQRLKRIHDDFASAFAKLGHTGPAVSVFGSARVQPEHPWYALGEDIGVSLARAGFTVITGGGPGLMEAVNSGAHSAGGHSVGIGIALPYETGLNRFVHTGVVSKYFFVRKLLFLSRCAGIIALPGGLGTLDEVFEVLTMMQTGKTAVRPVSLVGESFWTPLISWLSSEVAGQGLMGAGDLSHVIVTDSVDKAVSHMGEVP